MGSCKQGKYKKTVIEVREGEKDKVDRKALRDPRNSSGSCQDRNRAKRRDQRQEH